MSKNIQEIQIVNVDSEGRGIGRDKNNKVVFVPFALPQSKILAEITEEKSNFALGEIIETIEKSPFEILPECKHFYSCGGCTWQHFDYTQQIHFKKELLQNSFNKIAHKDLPDFFCLHSTNSTLRYRNKMEFSFGLEEQSENLCLGLKKRKSHQILRVDCLLCSPQVNKIIHRIEELAQTNNLPIFNASAKDKGFLRSVITRQSQSDLLIEILTYPNAQYNQALYAICRQILEEFPKISGIVHTLRKNPIDIAHSEKTVARFGKEEIAENIYLNEEMLELSYSHQSFFQVNTSMAQSLYSRLVSFAQNLNISKIADIYCGVGGIGIALAKALQKKNKKVTLYGLEAMPKAIEKAKLNAQKAEIEAEFQAGDAKNLNAFFKSFQAIECVILDPPRQGIDKESMRTLLKWKKPYILLVSCNPSTFARDIALLDEFYTLEKIEAFDLFPHTPHLESLALLTLKTSD